MAKPSGPIHTTTLKLQPIAPFDFYYTAYSHGWVLLLPNHWDENSQTLQRVERLTGGKVVLLSLSGEKSAKGPVVRIEVNHTKSLTKNEEKEIVSAVKYMLRLDEDLSEFYKICLQQSDRWKKLSTGLGRLFRSPTLFEDIVKTICTTNIQWGGTKRMIEELVSSFGEKYPGDPHLRAFPTPESIAKVSLESFSKKVRMGYRTEYIHLLAKQLSSREMNPKAFLDPQISTPDLKKRLLEIKGIGNYAAATLLMILGRYDELPTDTVFRDFVSEKYFKGKKVSDKKALSIYEKWGEWKYLAYWFELWQKHNENVRREK
jgi:3-methyladenine DNA glycosylase/8-oxoguanine DNA glycosylase